MTFEFPIGKDNAQKMKLTDTSTGSWATSDLLDVTRAVVTLGDFTVDSDDYPTAFILDSNDGTITLKFGMVDELQEPGVYNDARITIYQTENVNGIQWSPSFVIKMI
jgi:hypothetical protein